MKKGLSLLLLFTLTLFGTIGLTVHAEDPTDESFVFHVHQMDTDYTNTGIGVWDGTTWNNYADVVTSQDSFGGVIKKTYTAAAYTLVNNKTSVEFKPSRDVRIKDAEPKNVLLAPNDGKVFADISALNAAEVSEVDLYYVEGSKKIFPGIEGFGSLVVVFGNPTIVSNEAAYDGLTPTVTGNGTGGTVSAMFDYVYEGELFDIPGKTFMITVAADAADNTSLTIGGKTYTIPNTTLKTGGGQVVFVENGVDNYQTSGEAWGEAFELNYQLLAGNKFQNTTIIDKPNKINAEFLMAKNVAILEPSRFIVKDADDNVVPVESVTHAHTDKMGTYTPAVTPTAGQNYFVLRIKTNLDYTKIGLVGQMQGWNPDNAITASGLDSKGNAVFEAATTEGSGGYKLLYNENYGNEGVKFAWSDYQITTADQSFDFKDETKLAHYVDAQIVVVGSFTATKTAGASEKMLQVHLELDGAKDYQKLGIVGNINGWSDSGAIVASGVDSKGYVVFEVPTALVTGEYKILYDSDSNGFTWGDVQVTPENRAFAFGDASTLVHHLSEATKAVTVLGAPINTTSLETKSFTLNFSNDNMLAYGTDYTVTFKEVLDPEELIATKVLPFNLSHKLVEGDYVASTGTLALSPTEIQIVLNNRMDLLVSLVDDAMEVIATASYGFKDAIGTYTYTETAGEGEYLVRLHLAMSEREITSLNQLGLVGSVQGWSPDNAINPTGTDSKGYYVFEVVTTSATGEIKILFDADGAFNWGDAEVTPGNVQVKLDGGTYLIEEGATHTGSVNQKMTLSAANALSPDGTYYLTFTDENGFVYVSELMIDSEAPTITAPLKPGAEFILDSGETFNVLDYFTTISVVDNVDGEIDYVVTKNINVAKLGVQTFEIEATDSWGNKTTQSWQFTIGRGPVIKLTQTAIELQVNDTMPNWTSFATVDRGTLTINSSQVDLTSAGTYYVFYTATDATGSNQKVITVTVTAPEVPKTGCFSALQSTSALIAVVGLSLGSVLIVFIKKRKVI